MDLVNKKLKSYSERNLGFKEKRVYNEEPYKISIEGRKLFTKE